MKLTRKDKEEIRSLIRFKEMVKKVRAEKKKKESEKK